MRNTERIVDSVLLSVGSAYSLANIEHILGIIILIIQIGWIATKLILKIINAIKNKENLNIFDGDVKNLIGSIEDIIDKPKEEDTLENVNDNTEP